MRIYAYFLLLLFSLGVSAQEAKTLAAGRMAGELAISSTGAATYLVPLVVPPGIKEVVPSLALSYNSQGGDGIAGWGWNIAGLSTISRIGATIYHDGRVDGVDFDEHDRFALDGQRLIMIEGEVYGENSSVYTTENYSNIKVVASSNKNDKQVWTPESFTVYYPDGSRAFYTAKGDLEWAISSWEDPQGNTILYTYQTDGGTLAIDKIYYGAASTNPIDHPNIVRFHYQDKNLFSFSYVGGKNFHQLQYLEAIEITTAGEFYRKYLLTHDENNGEYKRLTQIEAQTLAEKKPSIILNYDNPANEIISVENTFQNFQNETDEDFDIRYHRTLSGDFNGDGQLDYLKYHKDFPDFTFYFDTEKTAYRFNTQNSQAIASGRKMIGFGLSQWQSENNHLSSSQALNVVSEKLAAVEGINDNAACNDLSTYKSTLYFSTYKLNAQGTLDRYEKKWDNSLIYNSRLCEDHDFTFAQKGTECSSAFIQLIPKETLSGDFNADGIKDLLLLQRPYRYEKCDGNAVNSHESRSSIVYWVNLDREKPTDFVSFAGVLNYPIGENDHFLVNDYNGDGRSDLWHFRPEEELIIYTLEQGRMIPISTPLALSKFSVLNQIVLGDFNGDGKTDFMLPKTGGQVESSTPRSKNNVTARTTQENPYWDVYLSRGQIVAVEGGPPHFESSGGRSGGLSSFNLKKVEGLPFNFNALNFSSTNYLERDYEEYHYLAIDVDGDGKSEIIRHEKDVLFSAEKEKYYLDENIWLYQLDFSLDQTTSFGVRILAQDSFQAESDQSYEIGIPIEIEYNQLTQGSQFSYLIGKRIYQKEFQLNHAQSVRLNHVSHQGMSQKIYYSPLLGQSEHYTPDDSQVYPYININNAPHLYLVTKVEATANGQTATQKFRYKGAVSHLGGLGFLGFLATGRTNSFGINVPALWTISQHDPSKRGAVSQSWTSVFNHFSLPNQYSQKTTYEYQSNRTAKGVFINLPMAIHTEDALMGFETLQSYTYDEYYNPTRIYTEYFSVPSAGAGQGSLQGSTNLHNDYLNHPSALDEQYHIGRLSRESRTESWAGRSHTTTTEYLDYDNNLLIKMRLQGDGTPWLTETMAYDAHGNLLSKILSAEGENDRRQGYTYTDDGRFLESSTDIEGLTRQYSYHTQGTLAQEIDPFGWETSYQYDPWQRTQSVTDYLGNSSQISYAWDNVDLVERQDGADGSASLRVIDPWGRERFRGEKMLNEQWRFTYTEYDVAGRSVVESEPYAVSSASSYRNIHATHSLRNATQYDAYGRMVIQAMATGKSISTTYTRGTPTTLVNDGYQEVHTTLDPRGRVAQLTDPNGSIRYTYHPTGELLSSDYQGHIVQLDYDGWGRKKSLSDPAAGNFSYIYDIFGQLTTEVSPWGTTRYSYDAQGKLNTKKQQGDNTDLFTQYSYDSRTKLLNREETNDYWNSDVFVKTIAYDTYQRPQQLSESNQWASFAQSLHYDAYGRIETDQRSATAAGASAQSVTLRHHYAANGQLNQLWANQKKLWELQHDNARGQAAQIQLGNGITKNNNFDALGFLEDTTHVNPELAAGGSVFSLDLNYDKKKGVLSSRTQKGQAKEVFTHDSRNRLSAVQQDSLQRKYRYDAYGRMEDNSRVGQYHYSNSSNRYTLDSIYLNASGKKFYTTHSRQTARYNIDRKAVAVEQEGSGRADFVYNGDLQRVHAFYGNEAEDWNERKYRKHYSTLFPVEIRIDQESGENKTLLYLGGDAYTSPVVLINGVDHYLHRDHLGSILAISDANGLLVEERHFTPWGEVDVFKKNGIVQEKFEDSLLPRGFTGHEHFTEVALIHMNGRMYDPQLRRFLSPDNHIQDPYDTRSYDRYAYTWHNPLMASDPSGEIIETIIAIVKIVSYISTAINTINAIANGANFGQVLFGIGVGIFLGQLGGAIGGSTSGLLSSSPTAFAKGFVGGFIGGFVSGTLGTVINGASIGDALKTGLISGAVAGVLAGLQAATNAPGAAIQADGGTDKGKSDTVSTGDGSRLPGGSSAGGGPGVYIGQVTTPGVMTVAEAGGAEYSPDWWIRFQASSNSGAGGNSLFGFFSNVFGSGAFTAQQIGGSIRFTKNGRISLGHYANSWRGNQYVRTHNLTKLGGRLGAGSSIIGGAYGINQFVSSDQSLGDYGRLGVSSASSALTLTPEPSTTILGLGIGFIDASGGFNSFYNFLDTGQTLYNSTGRIYLPYPY